MEFAKSCVCQHLVAKVGQTCCIGFGQFCSRENVFDLRKCPHGSMRRIEQVYVSRRVKAANLAMVKPITGSLARSGWVNSYQVPM